MVRGIESHKKFVARRAGMKDYSLELGVIGIIYGVL